MRSRVVLSISLCFSACVEPYRGVDVRPVPSLVRTRPRPASWQPAEQRVWDEVARLQQAAVTLAYRLAPLLRNRCEVASVAGAQAIVVARCESDQLFDPGLYSFRSSGALGAWPEVGRRIADILGEPAVGPVRVDVTGSVDEMPCCGPRFDRGARLFRSAASALAGVTIRSCHSCPPGVMQRDPRGPCNRCLSWTRGFAVAESIRSGLVPSRPSVTFTARGAGTCWIEAHRSAAPAPGCRAPDDCQRARTVDVTIHLLPRSNSCSMVMGDPASTLRCYQEVSRQHAGEVVAIEERVPPPSFAAATCSPDIEGVQSTPGRWTWFSTIDLGQANVSFALPRLP